MAEDRRNRVEEGDLLPAQQIRQAVQTLFLYIQRVERRAIEQGAEDATHGSVDAAGVEQRHPVVRTDVERVGVFPDVPQHVAVVLHHTFRPPGRAGRVEDVRQRIRRHREAEIHLREGRPQLVDVEDRAAGLVQPAGQGEVPVVRHDESRPGVLEDVTAPGGRIRRVERQVDLAHLQHAEDRADEGGAVLEQQGDRLLSVAPLGQDRSRYPVRGSVEIGVGQLVGPDLDRESLGVLVDLALEASRDRLLDLLGPELDERIGRAGMVGRAVGGKRGCFGGHVVNLPSGGALARLGAPRPRALSAAARREVPSRP